MLTQKEARKLLENARGGRRKLARNTYLLAEGENMVVRFWDTDIVVFRPDSTAIINTGGYRTLTTKDRLTRFSPIPCLYQEGGNWWIADSRKEANRTLFSDGIIINSENGKVISGGWICGSCSEVQEAGRAKW